MRDQKCLTIKTGDRIVLLEPIDNGKLQYPLLSTGRIVYTRNQVDADVWLYSHYCDLRDALQVSAGTEIEGVVLNLPKRKFGVEYHYQDHSMIQIDDKKVLEIPFFKETEYIEKIPALWYRGNDRGVQYKLSDIIDVIGDEFYNWVQDNLKFRRIFKHEKEDGYYPESCDRCLTDESSKKYYGVRHDLELKFAQITGIYKEYYGGLIFD